MKLSQKKTCNGCRATIDERGGGHCQFGHSLTSDKVYGGCTISYKPLEPCYKPKTNSELLEVIELLSPMRRWK